MKKLTKIITIGTMIVSMVSTVPVYAENLSTDESMEDIMEECTEELEVGDNEAEVVAYLEDEDGGISPVDIEIEVEKNYALKNPEYTLLAKGKDKESHNSTKKDDVYIWGTIMWVDNPGVSNVLTGVKGAVVGEVVYKRFMYSKLDGDMPLVVKVDKDGTGDPMFEDYSKAGTIALGFEFEIRATSKKNKKSVVLNVRTRAID